MKRIQIDIGKLSEREAAHEYLKTVLELPAYYGKNLDALYDCLTEMRSTQLVFTGTAPESRGALEPADETDMFHQPDPSDQTASRFMRVFRDAAKENPGLCLSFPEDVPGSEAPEPEGEGRYQLIALDLDGTALTGEKTMDGATIEAIRLALRMGKEVVFCTGRPVAEVRDFLKPFPKMHYLLCESGALLYDLWEEQPLLRAPLPEQAVAALEEVIGERDICPVAFVCGDYVIGEKHAHNMAKYRMGEFQEAVLRIGTLVDDVFAYLRRPDLSADKINLFHTTPEERSGSRRMLEEKGIPLYLADGEISSLECTALGVHKGAGLQELSQRTGIPLAQMIMVGDADNDLEALQTAGLAVAVGNASDTVKRACDAVVADNEHSGCAEAICKYLLA